MRTLLLLLPACLLTGCAGSIAANPPAPPPSLTLACAAPVALPERAMSDRDVEIFWGRDRTALRACAERHGALTDWVAATRIPTR